MAASSGVSVSGAQMVISGVVTSDIYFSLGLEGDYLIPPSRVGFYYLVRYRLSSGLDARVINTGVIFRPGTRIRRQDIPTDSAMRHAFWVDWNIAGLSWSMFTS
jgi:hypothetical protein